MKEVVYDFIKDIYHYNPDTGVFITKKRLGGRGKVGKIAGSLSKLGYITIHIYNKTYKAHRLAWLYVYGKMPNGHIDHINGNRADNRISNLRIASMRENAQNMECHRNGKLCGASYDKKRGLWESYFNIGDKKIHISRHKTESEAHEAYLQAIKTLTN